MAIAGEGTFEEFEKQKAKTEDSVRAAMLDRRAKAMGMMHNRSRAEDVEKFMESKKDEFVVEGAVLHALVFHEVDNMEAVLDAAEENYNYLMGD